MIEESFTTERKNFTKEITADLVVIGGGLAGVSCSITAARQGIKVILVQDRPVLGGNASSEVRLWILGATSHMGNNNRWAREGGVIDEILVENMYRNKEGNTIIFDTILLEKVTNEDNITLLLNTSIYQTDKKNSTAIEAVRGFCSQNSTEYLLKAPLFCDASGDGIVAFQSGASFRMGAESPQEFDEGFAPDIEDYGALLGHSMYFYTKDVGKPVKYVAPSFALTNVAELPSIKKYKLEDHGCSLWWIEYGGRLDTIHQSEDIKWTLWSLIYGLWDYVKNSGEFPEADNLTLEWVATIPGKRESRRFLGDYILTQKDIVEQRTHYDDVAYGGWSMDLHPADGVFGDKPGCNQWHSKGIYPIPYRCYYSKDIENLFLAGRIISSSHVAFGSSRVMATCAHGAQAVGMAAALATQKQCTPKDLSKKEHIRLLQTLLNRHGQSIPHLRQNDSYNKIKTARITASSTLSLSTIPFDGVWKSLQFSAAQLLPLQKNTAYDFKVLVSATGPTILTAQLRKSSKPYNYTPDVTLEEVQIKLVGGEQLVTIPFEKTLEEDQYAFVCLMANEAIEIKTSQARITGITSVFNSQNAAVSNYGKQEPPQGIGVDAFEFWIPQRRPEGHNIAMEINPKIDTFGAENLKNGFVRPYLQSNAYVADLNAENTTIDIYWEELQEIKKIVLFFDTDYDHPMESSLRGHPEDIIPFCVRSYQIINCGTTLLREVKNNHQTINHVELDEPILTTHLQLILEQANQHVPGALFEIQCF